MKKKKHFPRDGRGTHICKSCVAWCYTQSRYLGSKALTLWQATGVTGHVGFAVLVKALQSGYRVRAAVRRAEQESELRANCLISPFQDRLEFVVVPDITLDGAFDNALQDVTYIEHIASPAVASFKDVSIRG